MSSEWGRIDDDGTAYVRTADGERVVGSWQAGDAEAGLAYYVRHFEDLETEVSLLEKRLESGAGDPAATRSQAASLKEQVASASAIGDLASLELRLDAVHASADRMIGEAAQARRAARAEAVAAKEKLVAEAESIAEAGTSWKSSGDRLRDIVEEWKAIKGIDRKTDEALWRRFAAARDAFGKRRGAHFAQLDVERGSAKAKKEALVAQAEELSKSTDWKQTASDLKDLMSQWKAAPRASRDVEDTLWARFRAAQDAFFAARSAVLAERDAEQLDNQRQKQEVAAAAAALDVSDPKAAQAALRELQARFEKIGHIPREAVRGLEERMRAAEQRVRDAAEQQWRRSSVESNPFLAALRERLAEAEQKLERALKSGDSARIAKAQADVDQRRSLLPR
jgi:t-SNARE complex subunit (syntaxin)